MSNILTLRSSVFGIVWNDTYTLSFYTLRFSVLLLVVSALCTNMYLFIVMQILTFKPGNKTDKYESL